MEYGESIKIIKISQPRTLSTSTCIVGVAVSARHLSSVSRISHWASKASPVKSMEKAAVKDPVVLSVSCRSNIVTMDDRLTVSPSMKLVVRG